MTVAGKTPEGGDRTPGGSPDPGSVRSQSCPYRARVWWGDRLVADSAHTLRVEEPGREPELYFPPADLRVTELVDEGRERAWPGRGMARMWSIDTPEGDSVDLPAREWSDQRVEVSGRDCVWTLDRPLPGLEWLKDLVTFDHDRVVIELEDARSGDDQRDVTFKRFPTWGEASQLIEMLDVSAAGDGEYVSTTHPDHRRPVVEGSQILGQAIVAAGRHVPGRRVVSSQMAFLRAADARSPIELRLDELSGGRTFTCLSAQARQQGRLCACGILLLDVTAEDAIRHSVPIPEVAGPYGSEPYDMSVTGRDVRVVDGAYTNDPGAPVGPPVIDAWVRFRDVPDDPPLHAGLLAQFTGHMSIAAGLRPHAGIGQLQSHRTLSTAINSIALSVHGPIRADRWMLYHHESTFAGDGMTHSTCRVHDEDGRLLASFSVDAMVRKFAAASGAVDERRTL